MALGLPTTLSEAQALIAQATGTTSTSTSPSSGEDKGAKALIRSILSQWGLAPLADRLWKQYVNGAPIEQIFLDLRKTDEYKARFPGMAALSKKGRAISEAEYISLERSYLQIARAAGLPKGFYDRPDDFGRLIAGEVSPQEWAERVQIASAAAFSSPPELRSELSRLAGVKAGDLVAYWLDPKRALPKLQQAFGMAQLGAASIRTGFGLLTKDEASRLADLGISLEQATEGFASLADTPEEFFGVLPGEERVETEITRREQLGAAFEGNAAAKRRIQLRARRRVAAFDEGGGFAQTRSGFAGLGSV